MRNITTAKSSGFCFGVDRAVNIVYETIVNNENVVTLGPIIHNTQVTNDLKNKGVSIIESETDANDKNTVILRAHGVEKHVIGYLEENKISYKNATCPFVEYIQKLVWENSSNENSIIFIFGEIEHPEVKSINSFSNTETYIFNNYKQFENLLSNNNFSDKNIVMVSQTTANSIEYNKCTKLLTKNYTKSQFYNTICNATSIRQQEAVQLASKCDIIIVVGGKHSSNTAKLRDICKNLCHTVLIETANELYDIDFSTYFNIGITAGASTPSRIIKGVQTIMSEILNTIEDDDISFEEGLEQTLQSVTNGDRVTGIITEIGENEVQVEIGTKHAGYIPLNELTDDPTKSPEDLVKIDDKIELLVIRVNDVEGTVMLSKKRLDAIAGFDKIVEAEKDGTILEGIVANVVNGGIIAITNSTKVFIPASQATLSRNEDLEKLVRKTVRFKIIETNPKRKRAVGSIRAVLNEEREQLSKGFWQDVALDKEYKGEVKSLTNYGAFVDLGGVDGMIHISELSWSRIKHPSDIVKVGNIVDVYIKELDRENERISLGYKKSSENPWEVFRADYSIGDAIDVRIVSLTPFGAFANIIPGIDGLIHISQISSEHVKKPEDVLSVGQTVTVKISDVDYDDKRISLSIRALEEDNDVAKDGATPVEEALSEGNIVYEAGPDTKPDIIEDIENTEE